MSDPYWPLIPNEFPPKSLRWALPLTFSQLEPAYTSGLLSMQGLRELLDTPGLVAGAPPQLLLTFLRTASTFDRQRDIEEELKRLADEEDEKGPPLWELLAYLIVTRDIEDINKIYVLEDLYQKLGSPADLMPYTLYGFSGPPPGAKAIVAALRDKLTRDLRLP